MAKALLVAFLFLVHQVTAQPEEERPPLKKIKILSWNIYMLPPLVATHSGKKQRAIAIGEMLKNGDYDAVFFQEAFHRRARRLILSRLEGRYPYAAGPANKKFFSIKVSSGLWMLSRYPIVHSEAIAYKNKFGIDALSRKGAMLVELNVEGQHIQIAGTHLQNCGPVWLRQVQCVEFYRRLIEPNTRVGIPQIICGDFNIDRNKTESDYQFMLRALDAEDSNRQPSLYSYDRMTNDLHVEPGNQQDLIDYVLFRDNDGIAICTNAVAPIRKQWSEEHADLSDHYSICAEILFSNETQSSSVASAK